MIKSYCKLNLFLKVTKKLNNGLHNIQSNTVLINLYDKIIISPTSNKNDKVIFKGKFKKYINKNNNSITQTLSILRKNKYIDNDKKFKIVVDKKIPTFSGLGGGTSNAAYLISYFLKKKLKNKLLKLLEKKIGSDLRLFLFKSVVQKSLFKIEERKKNFKFFFILVLPKIKCSTKIIFSKVKKYSKKIQFKSNNFKSSKKYINFLKKERNDLQQIVIKKHKKIQSILDLISAQRNCHYSRITGSGSVCYGMFTDKKSAILGMQTIKKKLPTYWSLITKTI